MFEESKEDLRNGRKGRARGKVRLREFKGISKEEGLLAELFRLNHVFFLRNLLMKKVIMRN